MPLTLRPWIRAARTRLWALPVLLAVLFVGAVLGWAWLDDAQEREAQRQMLIADTLSAADALRTQLGRERLALRALADRLGQPAPPALARLPEVDQGLQGLWAALTWLDAEHRVKSEVAAPRGRGEGLTLHLEQALPASRGGERLLLRYNPSVLLRQSIPWWLARRYDIQLVDLDELVVATWSSSPARVVSDLRPSYRLPLDDAAPGIQLELILREPGPAGLRPLVGVLVAGFLPLSAAASALLRRQMRRVQQAEARWRAEASWRAAVEDSTLVGLRARDAQGRLLSVNRTFCDLVGWPAEDLVGRSPPMPYWPPDAIEEVQQRSDRNLAGGAPREGYEARWRHRSGRPLDVLVFESPLVDAQGQQVGWLGTILDITERKRLAENEARRVEREARTARLTMLGEVAATLAHELNQPLTAIASYTTGIANTLERLGVSDPLLHGALQRQADQTAQAGRVVHRIREFLTRQEPQLERCELEAILDSAQHLAAKSLQQHHVTLERTAGASQCPLWADPVLLEQVLLNLMRNAAEALSQRALPRTLRLHTQVNGRFVRVDLDDNGPGLEGRSPEQLFAPFYTTKAEGMGLGLAICRSIIEAHHGALTAEPSPLGGLRFSFSLPLFSEPHAPGLSG